MALGSGEFPSWSLAVKPLHNFLLSTQQRPCSVRKRPAHLPSSQPTVVSCPSPNTSPLVEQGPRQSLNKPFTLSCSALSTLYSFSQSALHTSTSGILFLLQGPTREAFHKGTSESCNVRSACTSRGSSHPTSTRALVFTSYSLCYIEKHPISS